MTARLADIAAQAGVSEATVSRVLNGKPGVSAATREAVLAALDILGYERPVRLRQRSAGLIGLIMPELDNPIFPAFAQVIERALIQRSFTPVLCTQTPGGVTEDEFTELLLERGVSGIVFVSGLHADSASDPSRYVKLVDRGVPLVMINGFLPGVAAPFISTDDREAMRLAVTHLVEPRIVHHACRRRRRRHRTGRHQNADSAGERGRDPQAEVHPVSLPAHGGRAAQPRAPAGSAEETADHGTDHDHRPQHRLDPRAAAPPRSTGRHRCRLPTSS